MTTTSEKALCTGAPPDSRGGGTGCNRGSMEDVKALKTLAKPSARGPCHVLAAHAVVDGDVHALAAGVIHYGQHLMRRPLARTSITKSALHVSLR